MLKFTASIYRIILNVLLWITLGSCSIGGCVLFFYLGDYSDGLSILGLFVGAIIGLGINILGGGFIANILNMVENIEKIKNSKNNRIRPHTI